MLFYYHYLFYIYHFLHEVFNACSQAARDEYMKGILSENIGDVQICPLSNDLDMAKGKAWTFLWPFSFILDFNQDQELLSTPTGFCMQV